MPQTEYDTALTIGEARERYFAQNGLGAGGYAERWVVLRAAGRPIGAFPNTAARVRSVRLHDVHHVLAGYDTSWLGEAEIGAWELASGCADHAAAWLLNTLAVLIGGWRSPRAVLRAASRGRRSRNLYHAEWDEALLDRRVGKVRAELGL